MKKGFKSKLIATGMALALCMCSCGKKSSIEDDYKNVKGTDETESTGEISTEETEIEQVIFNARCTKNGGELAVNAEVDTNIPTQIPVYGLKAQEIDDEFMKYLAGKIFGQGKYEIKKPVSLLTNLEIQEELTLLDEMIDNKRNQPGFYVVSTLYQQLRYMSEAPNREGGELEDGQVVVTEVKEFQEGDQIVPYTEYDGRIQGKYNGQMFELHYNEAIVPPNDLNFIGGKSIELYPVDIKPAVYSFQDPGKYGENKSDYETAEALAKEFINNIGYDYYDVAGYQEALCDGVLEGVYEPADIPEISAPHVNGYRFIFAPNVEGLSIGFYSTNRTTSYYDYDWSAQDAYLQPYISVDVNDEGIFCVKFGDMYEFGDLLTNDCNVIGVEQANESVKAAFEMEYHDYHSVAHIRFEYVVVKYEEEYALVPAWVYYTESIIGYEGTLMAVNAMDGSVVHFTENFDMFY